MVIDDARAIAVSEAPKPNPQKTAPARGRKPRVKSANQLAKEAETKRKRDENIAAKAAAKAAKEAAKEQQRLAKLSATKAKTPRAKAPKARKSAAAKKASKAKLDVEGEEDDWSDQGIEDDELSAAIDDSEDGSGDNATAITTNGPKKAKIFKPPPKFNFQPAYDATLEPLTTNEQFFTDLGGRLVKLGMRQLTDLMRGRPLYVGTFCSGTEAPILAMRTLQEGKTPFPMYA